VRVDERGIVAGTLHADLGGVEAESRDSRGLALARRALATSPISPWRQAEAVEF
jgi:hypothetical protein